jgi:hypothetical protein
MYEVKLSSTWLKSKERLSADALASDIATAKIGRKYLICLPIKLRAGDHNFESREELGMENTFLAIQELVS